MKSKFEVIINDRIAADIQETVDYYYKITKSHSVGHDFVKSAKKKTNSLAKDALLFAVRYKDIRCARIGIYPYMIHYTVDQDNKTVKVEAIINSYKNPEKHWIK